MIFVLGELVCAGSRAVLHTLSFISFLRLDVDKKGVVALPGESLGLLGVWARPLGRAREKRQRLEQRQDF